MVQLKPAERVHYQQGDGGRVIILDAVKGVWIALNDTASELWRRWETGEGFETGIATVAASYPQVPYADIHTDAERLLDELVSRGLIDVIPARSSGGVAMAEAPADRGHADDQARVLLRLAFLAFPCLVVACFLAHRRFRVPLSVVRASRRRWCKNPPSTLRAQRIVTAVTRAARYYPGRAACLELSLASVLLAAVLRQRLDWCLGSAPDPYQFHAWVEREGKPVLATGQLPGDSGHLRILAV
jgi:hypothetical protein